MKALLLFLCLVTAGLTAQTDTLPDLGDTTVYAFAEELPRFPTPCERLDTTRAVKERCAQAGLLDYIYSRILYPEPARLNNTSGTAVIGFIVERSGFINRPEVLRDPGDGLGEAALNAVYAMQREVLFRPAVKDSAFVRYRYVLPVKFKLEEPKPYVVSGRDTIYVRPTRSIEFTGNDGDVAAYFDEQLSYPVSGEDSCRVGQMDVQLLIEPNGLVRVQDILDYNDLGLDFTSEAIDVVTGSFGQWSPAEFEGRRVLSAYDISVYFLPTNTACAQTVADYNTALRDSERAAVLATDSTTLDQGLQLLDRAIDRFPRDGRFRIVRGQMLLDNNRLGEACTDLRLAKEIALVDWYDSLLPVICR